MPDEPIRTQPHRGVHEAAVAQVDEVRASLGQAFVPRGGPSRRVFDPARRAVLDAWVAALLPGDGPWPPAAVTHAADHVDATAHKAPPLRPLLLAAVDALAALAAQRHDGATAASLASDQLAELLRELSAGPHADAFDVVWELACEAYYRDPATQPALAARTGFSAAQATVGWELEPFEEALTHAVASRPSTYVEVSR